MSLVEKIDLLTGRIASEFRAVKTEMTGSPTGSASGLQTTAKNLVGAVNELKATTASIALSNKVLNLQAPTNPSTTAVINPAIAGIGNINGYVVNLSFGNFDEVGPILIDGKQQLNIDGPPAASTTAVTVKNGLTIQNSNGVRITRVQFEGNSSISCRAGTGLHFEKTQFMGNLALGGTGGFMMFTDCEIGGDITVAPTFAGVVYFIRCNFSKAAGVYTMGQSSAQQVIVVESTGVPNAGFSKASYSGTISYKNGTQALFNNGVAISTLGATSGQVLKFNGTAFVPAADATPDVTKAYVDAAVAAAAGDATDAVDALAANVYTISQADAAISTAINDLIGAAPGTLDTLGEIAAAIAADETAGAALVQEVALKAYAADVYTKVEADAALSAAADLKADKADTYTKAEVDSLVSDLGTAVAADLGDPATDFVAAFDAALIA